jgi:colanic acid biosynthesis glycosyl transferase WcaI
VKSAMTRLKILITSSYYWPEDAGSAPYLTGLAEHLSERGHDVVVATGFPHYPEWRSGAQGRLTAKEIHKGVRIQRRWHYVPSSQSAAQRAGYELSLLAFGLTAFPRRWHADVVVGTCPSVAGGVLAAAAAKRYRAPYGLVFQDLVGRAAAQSGIAGGARVAGIVRRVELGLAKGASGVGIIAEGFRGYLEDGGVPRDKIYRLRNWTRRVDPTETSAETRRRFGWGDDDFVCVHGGNMGLKQGLDNLLDTAALLGDNRVRIALVGDGNDRERLESQARERRLANVDFIAMQGPGNWEATMQAADVLLVNQRASVTDMSLPSKLTSYFASGRPVIAAASPDSETAAEIEAAGAGLVVPPADPTAFRAAIVELEQNRPRAEAMGTSGKGYADSALSRASALAEYDEFIERLLAAAR